MNASIIKTGFRKLSFTAFYAFVSLVVMSMSLAPAYALPGGIAQRTLFDEGVHYFDICGGSSSSSSSSSTSGTPSGGVQYDDSQSVDTSHQTTYETDTSTSYGHGLSSFNTNFVALNPEWSAQKGIVVGDVVTITYQGKTIYGIYGDNHSGGGVHTEISIHADLALQGTTDQSKATSLKGVHFAIYPNTSSQINGATDQSKIDQVGAQVSGIGTSSDGNGSALPQPTGCCNGAAAPDTTGTASGSVVWPFATKSNSQYQRVDQGWDIQDKAGANIYAIAPGTLHVFQPDSGNFGNDYPTEKLDNSIGGPSDWVYYGHVHIASGLDGKHVTAGQLIAHTNVHDGDNGSGAPPGWLEIGFAQPGTDAPVDHGSGPTAAGQKMKDILINTKASPNNSSSSSSPSNTDSPQSSGASCCPSDTPPTNSSSTLSITYKDPGRGNRQVPVTVYLPTDSQPHPLLVFAPGRDNNSKPDGIYARYLQAIANKGFVVGGLDFTDNNSEGAIPGDAKDFSFAVNQLLSDSQVKTHIATNVGVGGFGHSDGGTVVMESGYGSAKNSHIKAVLAGSGGINGVGNGPPLLVMDGTADFAQAQADSAYTSAHLSYKAKAAFKGASHSGYMVDNTQYNQPTNDLTVAFFTRFLEGSSTADLKGTASKYSSLVNFQEQGSSAPQGSAPSSASSSASGQCCPSGGGGGTLPSYVKEPYNKIFSAAAAKYHVDAAVLVAIFYTEQYGYTNAISAFKQHEWPNPPPPYGSGAAWNNGGGAGAQGAFQFLPSTFKSAPGVDGNGDGKADPNDLTDAAFTAAEGFSNGLFGGVKLTASSSAADVAKMAGHYYGDGATGPGSYGGAAGEIFKDVKADEGGSGGSASTSSSSSSSSCSGAADGTVVFPLKISVAVGQSSWTQDMGVDIATNGSACGKASPEYAMGNGVIVGRGISGFGPDAPVLHITDTTGPLAGRYLYYGHAGDSQSSNGAGRPPGTDVGGKVTAGQVITYTGCGDVGLSTGPHIEIGIFPKGASSATAFPAGGQTSGDMLQILKDAYKNKGKGQQPTP